MIRVRKILYPTDFSPYSNQAYFHAIALAEVHRASLTILYVCVPGTAGQSFRSHAAELEHWRDQLQQIRPTDNRIPVEHVLLEGDPANEIVRYACDAGMDLIVMGTHGRTGLERLLMGSVAEKVMRESPCSVMVVKLARTITVPEKADMAIAVSPA
jgi:nucleotide-binding universal stress UspA family protein